VIIGYARVSSSKADQDISIEDQVAHLQELGCDRIIAERRSAYTSRARRGWDELLELVASGKVRKVITRSLARMSRKGEDVAFLRMCARKGVEVQLLDGTNADVSDPSGKLMTSVLSAVNEVDSMIKSINIRNGLNRRKAAGHYACGRLPFGYAYDGSKVVAHPVNFAAARVLWDRLAANEFNAPVTLRQWKYDRSPRGVYLWINNPILRGIIRNEADKTEALISWHEWQQASGLIEGRRTRGTRAPKVRRLFSGLITCDGCEGSLHYFMNAGKQRLKCTRQLCQYLHKGLAEWKVKQQVIDELCAVADVTGDAAALPTPDRERPEQEEKRRQLAQLEALNAQGVPGLAPTIEALRLELLAPPAVASANWAGYRELFRRPAVLAGMPDEELRAVLLEFLAEIRYVGDPGRVKVRLRDRPGGGSA
jgi:hypothetical protein